MDEVQNIPVELLIMGETIIVPIRTMGTEVELPREITHIVENANSRTLHYAGGKVVVLYGATIKWVIEGAKQ